MDAPTSSHPPAEPVEEMEKSGFGKESGHAEKVKKQILSDGQKPLKSLTMTDLNGTGPRTTSQTQSSSSSSSPSPTSEPQPGPERKSSADHGYGSVRNSKNSVSSDRDRTNSSRKSHRKSPPRRSHLRRSRSRSSHTRSKVSESRPRHSGSRDDSRRRQSGSRDDSRRHQSGSRYDSRRHQSGSRYDSRRQQSGSRDDSRRRRSGSRDDSRRQQSGSRDDSRCQIRHSSSNKKSSPHSYEDSKRHSQSSYRDESRSSRGRRRSRSNELGRKRRTRSRSSHSPHRRYRNERDYIPEEVYRGRNSPDSDTNLQYRYECFSTDRPETRTRTSSEERRRWEDTHGIYVRPQSDVLPNEDNEEYYGECSSTTTIPKDNTSSSLKISDCTDSANRTKVVDSLYLKSQASPDTTCVGGGQDLSVPSPNETYQPNNSTIFESVGIPTAPKKSSTVEKESGLISNSHSSSSSNESNSAGKKQKKSKKSKRKLDDTKKSHKKDKKGSKKRTARDARRNERLKRQKSGVTKTVQPFLVQSPPKPVNSKEKPKPVQKPSDDPMLEGLRKSLKPMSFEEYQKQQSVTRRVFDPSTGRERLIRGEGEVIEEIVSKSRHQQINRTATAADGKSFQATLASKK